MARDDELERITRVVVDCGYRLHTDVGPGLLESVYEIILAKMLAETGLSVARQVVVPIKYDGVVIDNAFRADLVRSEEHTSELQSLMRISYAVFCLKKKKRQICIKNIRQ